MSELLCRQLSCYHSTGRIQVHYKKLHDNRNKTSASCSAPITSTDHKLACHHRPKKRIYIVEPWSMAPPASCSHMCTRTHIPASEKQVKQYNRTWRLHIGITSHQTIKPSTGVTCCRLSEPINQCQHVSTTDHDLTGVSAPPSLPPKLLHSHAGLPTIICCYSKQEPNATTCTQHGVKQPFKGNLQKHLKGAAMLQHQLMTMIISRLLSNAADRPPHNSQMHHERILSHTHHP